MSDEGAGGAEEAEEAAGQDAPTEPTEDSAAPADDTPGGATSEDVTPEEGAPQADAPPAGDAPSDDDPDASDATEDESEEVDGDDAGDDGTDGSDGAGGEPAPDADENADATPASGMVYVDTIGVPEPPKTLEGLRILGAGLPETARQRLEAAGVESIVETAADGEVDVAVISTRLPRGELPARASNLRQQLSCPLVVLVHTSGEGLASRLMARGAAGVLAEGNEQALGAVLAAAAHDQSLVETYERQLSHNNAGAVERGAIDPQTGMLRAAAFEQRLLEYGQSGDTPRIGFGRVLRFESSTGRLSPMAKELIRRRLALDFVRVSRRAGIDLYAVSPAEIAVISDELSPHEAESLARTLAKVTARYAPNGTTSLGFAFGHAGPEVTTELSTLKELSQRALSTAAMKGEDAVVGAEALSLGVSSTTELEVATRMVEAVEKEDAVVVGHGERVAGLVAEMAAELGYDGVRRARVRLAALLHDIGKIALPTEALRDPSELQGDLAWAYRSHPVRGADHVRPSAGDEVAAAIRGQHERVDGSGFPEGLVGDEIPVAARMLAVACRFDLLRHGRAPDQGLEEADAVEALRAEAGDGLDPELVDLAVTALRARASLEPVAHAA